MKGYKNKKAGGLIEVVIVGDVAYTSEARFSPETGQPAEPILTAVSEANNNARLAELDAQIAEANAEKDDIAELTADVAAKKPKKPK